jgi:hypothetical protein
MCLFLALRSGFVTGEIPVRLAYSTQTLFGSTDIFYVPCRYIMNGVQAL